MFENIEYLFRVHRMIRLLISLPSFLVCTLVTLLVSYSHIIT